MKNIIIIIACFWLSLATAFSVTNSTGNAKSVMVNTNGVIISPTNKTIVGLTTTNQTAYITNGWLTGVTVSNSTLGVNNGVGITNLQGSNITGSIANTLLTNTLQSVATNGLNQILGTVITNYLIDAGSVASHDETNFVFTITGVTNGNIVLTTERGGITPGIDVRGTTTNNTLIVVIKNHDSGAASFSNTVDVLILKK